MRSLLHWAMSNAWMVVVEAVFLYFIMNIMQQIHDFIVIVYRLCIV